MTRFSLMKAGKEWQNLNDVSFRLLGVRFRVSFWFAALLSLYTLVFEDSLRVLLAVVLHECGHGLAIYLCGSSIETVSLRLTDIRMTSDLVGLSRSRRILIAFAGPSANILGSVISLLYDDTVFFSVNLVVGLFQLLPAAGSDGGEILHLLLGERKSRILCFLTAFLVCTGGILLIVHNRYNFSLLIAGLYIIFMACK